MGSKLPPRRPSGQAPLVAVDDRFPAPAPRTASQSRPPAPLSAARARRPDPPAPRRPDVAAVSRLPLRAASGAARLVTEEGSSLPPRRQKQPSRSDQNRIQMRNAAKKTKVLHCRANDAGIVRVGSKTEARQFAPLGRFYEGFAVSFFEPDGARPKGRGALMRDGMWRYESGTITTGVLVGLDPESKKAVVRRTVAFCAAEGVTDVEIQETVPAVWFQSPKRQDWQSRSVPVETGGVVVVSDDEREAARIVRRGRLLSALLGNYLSLNDEGAMIGFLGILFEQNAERARENRILREEYPRRLAEWRAACETLETDLETDTEEIAADLAPEA